MDAGIVMKRLLATLAILLFALPSHAEDRLAWGTMMIGGGTPAGAPACADSSCAGFLTCQNFEGTGYDQSETWEIAAGTPDPDYTTTALRGSQSWYGASVTMAYKDFTASDHVYFFFRARLSDPTAGQMIWMKAANDDDLADIRVSSSEGLFAVFISGYNSGSFSWSVNTTYFIWGEYNKNTAIRLWVSTTKTKPGTPDIEVTAGVPNIQIGRIGIGRAGAGTAIYDQVLVSTSVIGDVCD